MGCRDPKNESDELVEGCHIHPNVSKMCMTYGVACGCIKTVLHPQDRPS